MTNINLAPYSVHRFFDGAEVMWIVEKDRYRGPAARVYETREEAEAERNRLNTAYGLDKIGV